MKSLLVALGLALCCFVQANKDQRFEDTDPSLLPGDAIVTAIASNCQKMKQMAAGMPAFHVSFKEKSQDELQMTMNMATPDGCKTMSPKLKKENGVFTTRCGHGGKKTMEYIQLNGDGSMFTSITLSHQGGQCSIATLTVTDLANTQGALDGFRAFARRHNLGSEEVKVLSTQGMCPPSS
uniref:Lipocalin n=1 Tax=Oxyrhopus guibei TaxID=120313 RepID=A0A2Z1V1H6_OXYGU|nr:lipocalin [Oxyrhopus guibei]